MDVLNLAIFYVVGCVVGACCIWVTNCMAVYDLDLAPYDYAWFSWGFVFWFLVIFICLLFHHED